MSVKDANGEDIAIGDQVATPDGTQDAVVSVVSHLNVKLTTGEILRGRSIDRTGVTGQTATATGNPFITTQGSGTGVGAYSG